MCRSASCARSCRSRGCRYRAGRRLERAGLVTRQSDPDDRRRVLIEITPLAREFGARHLRPLAHRLQHFVATTDAAELAAVQRFLSALLSEEAPRSRSEAADG